MSPPESNVLILGASVRAAAFSALRAGLSPRCVDLFADADLCRHCPAVRLPGPYPHAFLDLVANDQPGPWVFTGGLENHPLLVGQMQDRRRLWGNGPAALLRARDPEVLASAASAAGLPSPALALSGSTPARGSWLLKPRAGVGGIGIRPAPAGDPIPAAWFAQQFIPGTPAAAVFVAVAGRSVCLGLTRQLVGESWLFAPAFRYCGSIGPLAPPPALGEKLRRLGAVLVRHAELAGIFGVDGILTGETFSPIEVNPRFTASVEILELATGVRAFDLHRRAFEYVPRPAAAPAGRISPGTIGKAILFAPADCTFPSSGPWTRSPGPLSPDSTPDFADIPHAGEKLKQKHPILTVFATGRDEADCEVHLRRRTAEVIRRLYPDKPQPDAGAPS